MSLKFDYSINMIKMKYMKLLIVFSNINNSYTVYRFKNHVFLFAIDVYDFPSDQDVGSNSPLHVKLYEISCE